MTKKDIRKEQLALLRFEKQIAGLATVLAAGAATSASANDKLGGDAASQAYADIQASLVHLADVTAAAHEKLNVEAVELGFRVSQVFGTPKPDGGRLVRSILGIG